MPVTAQDDWTDLAKPKSQAADDWTDLEKAPAQTKTATTAPATAYHDPAETISPLSRWKSLKMGTENVLDKVLPGMGEKGTPSPVSVAAQAAMIAPLGLPERLGKLLMGYFTARTAYDQPAYIRQIRDEIKQHDLPAATHTAIEDLLNMGMVGAGIMGMRGGKTPVPPEPQQGPMATGALLQTPRGAVPPPEPEIGPVPGVPTRGNLPAPTIQDPRFPKTPAQVPGTPAEPRETEAQSVRALEARLGRKPYRAEIQDLFKTANHKMSREDAAAVLKRIYGESQPTTQEAQNAEAIRRDQGQLRTPGEVTQGGEAPGGDDLEQTTPGQPQPVEPGEKAPAEAQGGSLPLKPETPSEPVKTPEAMIPAVPETAAPSGEAATKPTFKPALLVNGKPVVGGNSHAEILQNILKNPDTPPDTIDAAAMALADDSKHVFVDENGRVYDRKQAAAALGVKGELHSENLTATQTQQPVKPVESTPAAPAQAGVKPAAKEPAAQPAPAEVGPGAVAMGGDVPHERESLPTIEDQLSGNPLAPPRSDNPPPPIEPAGKEAIGGFTKAAKDFIATGKGWLGGMAGKTFPKTTLLSKRLGELGARWISSKIAARPKAEVFTAEVIGDSGLSSRDVGAALTEDNLRSIKQAYEQAGDQESADSVQSIIGKKGSPFKTEREYQDYLANPKFQEVVKRHIDMWQATVEPQYREAMQIDPETELPSRGLQTGARINLRAVREGENPRNVVRTAAQGNLLGTLRKKSPFGVQATGAADAYHADLHDLMENTFGKQDEIANKNAFESALVKGGQAVIGKPGQEVLIGGKRAVAFPLKRQTVIVKGGKPVSQNRMIYVNPRIASEYRIAAKVDAAPEKGVLAAASKAMNTTAIASGTEATTHVMNLGSAIFSLPSTAGKILNDGFLSAFGRADIPIKLVRIIRKSFQDNRAQIAGLSEIGAMREQRTPTAPILKYGTKLIQWMDKNTRLVLDDAYQSLAKEGLVENSETARREFVNQVGQYNTRAQPYLMGKMRQLGISPFVTAGKNFNTLGIREAMLNPGVKATGIPAAIALRANMLSKWIGTAALITTANYLLTKNKGGGAMGRPGTPLGSIDTGQKDKNGRNIFVNVLNITGQGRALRVTGLRGAIDAERMGLGAHNAIDAAQRDMINTAISPWAGPVPRFAVGAATGQSLAVNVGRQFPVVPPGTSQHLSDFKNAVINLSPVTGGIQKAMQPQNQGWWEIIKSQFPRLVPQSGRPDSMTENFPEIVQKAQANDFISYIIHAARTVPIDQRQEFLTAQIERLPAELRSKAWTEVKWKKAMSSDTVAPIPAPGWSPPP